MRIRENLAPIVSSIGRNNSSSPFRNQIGKVYGVVLGENNPSQQQFERVGGYAGLGTILYLEYDQTKNLPQSQSDAFWNTCKTASPLNGHLQYYPLVGELVLLEDAPSPSSQLNNNQSAKYYSSIVNIWNNTQHNALLSSEKDKLGEIFSENNSIRNMQAYEGDCIINGRFGNTIRFSSTNPGANEWSSYGNVGDPILLLTNGHLFNSSSLAPYTEKIALESALIYLTSGQKLPLQTDIKAPYNVLTNALAVENYSSPQILLNSSRIVLNSSKDEVMMFAKTNIEISTKNIINLNAQNRVHFNSPRIFLGSQKDGSLPIEPLLLGGKTINLLSDILSGLYKFCTKLTTVIGAPEGAPISDLNVASEELMTSLEDQISVLSTLISQQNFTC